MTMIHETRHVYYMYRLGEARTFASTTTPSVEWAASLRQQGYIIVKINFVIPVQADEVAGGMVRTLSRCPDCGVLPDQAHRDGCDVARCSVCRGQRLCCDCAGHDPAATKWTGEWPGVAECRERGWYAVLGPDGWQRCEPGTPGCMEDLNRWNYLAQTGQDLYDETGKRTR